MTVCYLDGNERRVAVPAGSLLGVAATSSAERSLLDDPSVLPPHLEAQMRSSPNEVWGRAADHDGNGCRWNCMGWDVG